MSNIQAHEVGKSGKYYRVTGLTSAKTIPGGQGTTIMIQAEGQPVRYRIDGTDPTTTVGFRLGVNETHTLNLEPGQDIRVIETAATATLNVNVLK